MNRCPANVVGDKVFLHFLVMMLSDEWCGPITALIFLLSPMDDVTVSLLPTPPPPQIMIF
jgi:hypothetical protein